MHSGSIERINGVFTVTLLKYPRFWLDFGICLNPTWYKLDFGNVLPYGGLIFYLRLQFLVG